MLSNRAQAGGSHKRMICDAPRGDLHFCSISVKKVVVVVTPDPRLLAPIGFPHGPQWQGGGVIPQALYVAVPELAFRCPGAQFGLANGNFDDGETRHAMMRNHPLPSPIPLSPHVVAAPSPAHRPLV